MRTMFDYLEESMILEKIKKRRQCENEINEESEYKQVKRITTLVLHSSTFSTFKQFATFASKILNLRDSSAALHALDFYHADYIEPQLLIKILNYVSSHNDHLHELGIYVRGYSCLIMSRVSSCRALTSLKFSLSSIRRYDIRETLFPKNLNLPLLSSLVLENFAFCGGENGCAEPFSTFTKLNSLILRSCEVKDAQILSISSETLVKLALLDNFAKIELSVPSLCTFTFTGDLIQKICGSSLSSIKQVNIDHEISPSVNNALALLSCLQDLANVELLTVNSTTLEVPWHVFKLYFLLYSLRRCIFYFLFLNLIFI